LWIKSSYSGTDTGNCLEWRRPGPAEVGIADSKDHTVGTLAVSAMAWAAFVHGTKNGAFYHQQRL
jgi:hypothetical protein